MNSCIYCYNMTNQHIFVMSYSFRTSAIMAFHRFIFFSICKLPCLIAKIVELFLLPFPRFEVQISLIPIPYVSRANSTLLKFLCLSSQLFLKPFFVQDEGDHVSHYFHYLRKLLTAISR